MSIWWREEQQVGQYPSPAANWHTILPHPLPSLNIRTMKRERARGEKERGRMEGEREGRRERGEGEREGGREGGRELPDFDVLLNCERL